MGDLVELFGRPGPRQPCRRATSAVAWYERGLALEVSDPDAAITAYSRAIAGRPGLADAHNNLGRLLHDRGDLAAAEACYRRALACDDRVGLYHFNLGVVLEDRGCHAGALAAYEAAITLDPALADAHYNLARQLERAARASVTGDELLLRRAFRHLGAYRALCRAIG